MKESAGNTELVRSLKHYGWRAYKISDQQGSRFTETKPCDIIARSPKGRYVPIEAKMMKKWMSLTMKSMSLRPNQIEELDAATTNGGFSFLMVHVRIPPVARKQKRVTKLVVFDWAVFGPRFKKGGGIDIEDMRAMSFGWWYDPIKDKNDKIMWPIHDILIRGKRWFA